MAEALSGKRRQILDFIAECQRERGYPPSVREIGAAVGLTSSATVQSHLKVLQQGGYLLRDPTKPRAIQVSYEPSSGVAMAPGPVRQVPLVGEVAAGTGVLAHENVEEVMSLPEQFTGTGSTFMLRGPGRVDDRGRHLRRRLRRRPPAARRGERRRRRGRHPRRRGDGEDVQPTPEQGGPDPGEPDDGADGALTRPT